MVPAYQVLLPSDIQQAKIPDEQAHQTSRRTNFLIVFTFAGHVISDAYTSDPHLTILPPLSKPW